MIGNLKLAKAFWTITTALATLAALSGILWRDSYIGLVPPSFEPGAFPQDVLTLLVCIATFALIARTSEGDVRRQVIIIGVQGALFYLYGIFTIERVYNAFYLLYAAVFGASFWSLAYTLGKFRPAAVAGLRLGSGMLRLTAISSLFIALIFTGLWVSALLPLMRSHDRIDFLYSIYILDLCFIMPAFIITAVMALRGMPLGILMGPAIMILGFFVIFPLGLNEIAKPAAGMVIEYGPMAVSFVFAAYMLALAALQLKQIELTTK